MWELLLIVSAYSQTCPTYSCHAGGYSISPTCAMLSPDNDIVLEICDASHNYCDITSTITKNYTCTSNRPPARQSFAYPGERCYQNSDCTTNVCTNQICQGQNPGGPCVGNSDCDVGLYCGSGFFCVPQLPYGSSCSNDFQCQNNLACNRTIFEDGTCIGYFSVPNGGLVGLCQDMLTEAVSNLCMSGSCIVTSPNFTTVGYCQPAYKNVHGYPWQCETDVDCVGYNGASTTQGTCSCGMASNGNAYCDSFANDPPGFTNTLLTKVHVNSSSIYNCHTQRRFDVNCLFQNLGPAQVSNFLYMRELQTDTARYMYNDHCTQVIFNFNHFNPRNYQCPAYGCGSTQGWTNGTCVTFAEGINTFAIQQCSNSATPYCDISISEADKWTNVTCQPAPGAQIKYPGDPCVQGVECNSGVCTNKVCQGVGLGQHCQSSQSCNVGLYCNSQNYQFTCQPLIQPYSFGCGSDFDCVNWCGCRFTSNGPPGTCIPYFSLAANATVQCPKSGISYLCSTGSCFANGTSFDGVCTKAPVSVNPLPTTCTMNGQCIGKNTLGQSFQGTCTCGYNLQGNSYCSVFSGDAPGVAFFKTLKKILTNTTAVSLCQTTRRLQFDCFNIVANAVGASNTTWYAQMLNFTMYPYFIGNDQCVKSVYTSQYWNNIPSIQDFEQETISDLKVVSE